MSFARSPTFPQTLHKLLTPGGHHVAHIVLGALVCCIALLLVRHLWAAIEAVGIHLGCIGATQLPNIG